LQRFDSFGNNDGDGDGDGGSSPNGIDEEQRLQSSMSSSKFFKLVFDNQSHHSQKVSKVRGGSKKCSSKNMESTIK
jgi:hypothetical protein